VHVCLEFFFESCLLELIAKTRFVNQHNACALDHVTLIFFTSYSTVIFILALPQFLDDLVFLKRAKILFEGFPKLVFRKSIGIYNMVPLFCKSNILQAYVLKIFQNEFLAHRRNP
jgi:hypothetical protein